MKPDASPTARALLALELVQGSPGITADRLADKLGVSERAARRYVGILREAGIPIESVRGPYGGYRVGRGLRLPPLMFSAAEALGLVMAVLDGHHDASDPTDPVGSALGKIVRALPEPVAAQAEAVRRTTAPAPDRAAARPDPATTTALVQACADHRQVRLGYRSEAGSEWVIEVDPWAVVVRHGRWYLLCRSHRADARRAYRIDRVRAVRGARRHLQPTRRPRPGRRARGAPRRRLGVRRRGRHRRARSRPWRGACPAPSGGSSRSTPGPAGWSAAPATRAGTPSSSRCSRRRTGSCGAPSSRRPRASSGSGCWRRVRVHTPAECRRAGRRTHRYGGASRGAPTPGTGGLDMRTALKTTLAAAAVGALALGLGPSLAYGDRGSPAAGGYGTGRASVVGTSLTVIGLTRDGQRLTRFDTAFPAYTRGRTTVKRLQTDVRLLGIDYRRAGRRPVRRRRRRRRLPARPVHRERLAGGPADGGSAGQHLRRGLRPGRQRPAGDQRPRPEPAPALHPGQRRLPGDRRRTGAAPT